MAAVLQLVMVCVFISSAAFADIYKYTDDSGSITITNSLQSVPKKFRSSMTMVKEDVPVQKKLLPEVERRTTDPASAVQAVMPQIKEQNNALPLSSGDRKKYINTAVVIAGLVALYFLLGRVSHIIGFRRAWTALFLLLVLTGGVYLYGMYIQELRVVFGTLRRDALNIKKNVETRDQKTDQLLKQIEVKEQAGNGN